MKKSLVLAMAMALGVTASAYAANPFSDVPAGHWAYDSVNKLAAAGVVDGYPAGTYGGDKLMTRYEMAQIVAKAMAKGANVDKLAAEFADELDALGVRVANLEAKADNVKITGEVRYHYTDNDGDVDGYASKLRSRIYIKGAVNDDWTYTGMLQNEQNLLNETGDEDVDFQRAYVNGKIGGVAVQAGRYSKLMAEGNVYDCRFDGVEASYGKDVKLTLGYGKANDKDDKDYADEVMYADLGAKFDALTLSAGYYDFSDLKGVDDVDDVDDSIWAVNAKYDFNKDLSLAAMYLNGDKDDYEGTDDGFVVTAAYKGAKASEAGSWGLTAKYYDQGASTYVKHTMNGQAAEFLDDADEGFTGYSVAANYAFAKNIVGQVEYYDLEAKEGSKDAQTIWSQLVFNF